MPFDPTKVDAARALERTNRGRGLDAAVFKKPAGEFKKGLRAGARQLSSIGKGIAGAANELIGDPEAAQQNLESANRDLQEAAVVGPRVKQIEDISSATDLKDWAAGMFGQVLPVMAPMVIGGPAGIAAKRLVGAAIPTRTAAIGGAVLGSSATETGLIFNELQDTDSDLSGRQKALTALGFGTAAGSLDVLPVIQVFNKFGIGKAAKRVMDRSLVKDIAKGAGQSAVLEGTTEGVQTILERAAVKFADENFEVFGEEGMSELANAIAAGFTVGAGFGGVGSGAASLISTDVPPGGKPTSVGSPPGSGIFSRIENKMRDLEADEELLGAGFRTTVSNIRQRLFGVGRDDMVAELDGIAAQSTGATTEEKVKFSRTLESGLAPILDVLETMTPEQQAEIPNESINKVATYINAPTDVGYELVRADAELLFGVDAKSKITKIRDQLIGVKKADVNAFFAEEDVSRETIEADVSKESTGQVGLEIDHSKPPTFIHKRTVDGLEINKVSDLHSATTAHAAIRKLTGATKSEIGVPIQEKNSPNVYTIVPAREGILDRNKAAGGVILDPAVGEGKFVIKQERTAGSESIETERQLTRDDLQFATAEQIGTGNVIHRDKVLRRFNKESDIEDRTAHFKIGDKEYVNIPSLVKKMIQKSGSTSSSNNAIAEAFLNGFVSLIVDHGYSAKQLSKQLHKGVILFYRGRGENAKPIKFGTVSRQMRKAFSKLSQVKDLTLLDEELREQFGAEPSTDFEPVSEAEKQDITGFIPGLEKKTDEDIEQEFIEKTQRAAESRRRKKKLSGPSPTIPFTKRSRHRGRIVQLFNQVTEILGLENLELLDTVAAKQWAFENNQPELRASLQQGSIHGFNVGNVIYVNPKLSEREQFSTIAHELGHVVYKNMFEKLDTNGPTYKAIMNEYITWVNAQEEDKSILKVLASRGAQVIKINNAWKTKGDIKLKDLSPSEKEYILDFEEWFADQLSVYMRDENTPAKGNQAAIKKFALRLKAVLAKLISSLNPTDAPQTHRFFAALVMARQSRGYRAHVSEIVSDIDFSRSINKRLRYDDVLKPFKLKNIQGFDKELQDPLIQKYLLALDKSTRAEFIGLFDDFSAEEKTALRRGDSTKFSELRGYTEQEIKDLRNTGRLNGLIEDKYGGIEGDLDFSFALLRAYHIAVDMDSVNEEQLKINFSRKINTSGKRGKVANNILLSAQMQQDPYSIESLSHAAEFLSKQLTEKEQAALNRALSRKSTRDKIEEIIDSVGLPLDVYHAVAFQLWMDNQLNIGPETRTIFHKLLDVVRKILGTPSADHLTRAVLIAVASGGITKSSRTFNIADVGKSKIHKTRAANFAFDVMDKVVPMVKVFGFTADSNMRNKNPIFTSIADLFHARVGLEGVNRTYFEERTQMRGRFDDILQHALDPLNDEDVQKVFTAAQSNYNSAGLNKRQKTALANINGLFKEANRYLVEAGVLSKVNPNTYFPRIYDYDLMRNKKPAFLKMLNSDPLYLKQMDKYAHALHKLEVKNYGLANATSINKLRAKMPETIYGWIMANDGNVETVISTSPQITVEAGFMNMRKFNWLNDADLQPFMSTDFNYIMSTYIDKSVKTAAFRRRVGPGEINQLVERARDLGATDTDVEQALDMVNAMIGRAGLKNNQKLHSLFGLTAPPGQVINPTLQQAMSAIIVARNLMVLGLATFTSLVDPLGILVRSGDFDTAWQSLKVGGGEIRQGIKNLASKKQQQTEATLLAQTLGTIDVYTTQAALEWEYGGTYMTGTMKRINEGFFKFIGLTQWTQLTRTMATTGAIDFITKHAKGDYTKNSMRYLRQLDLVPQDLKFKKDGSLVLLRHQELLDATSTERSRDARVKNAINRFVDESILRPNAAQRPIWASDPHWMLVFHLQSFMYSFHDRILRRVYTEYVDHKNITPALMLMTFPIMMLAVNDLRDKIKYLGDDNPRKANWDFYDHFFEAMDRSGIPGVAGSMILSAKTDMEYGGFGWESRIGVFGTTSKNVLRGRPLISNIENLLPLQSVWKNWDQ